MSATTTQNPERGKWNGQKNKLKTKFSTLTDEDLNYEEDQKDVMFSRLRAKLGKTQEELNAIISSQIIY